MIKQAPLLFFAAFAILAAAIGLVEYYFFKANLDRKNDLIKTLQDQLATTPTSRVPSPREKPELRLSMSGGNVFVPGTADMDTLTGISIGASVWNTGSSTVATGWSLAVIPRGTTPLMAQHTTIPDQLRLGGPNVSAVIRASESLATKTSQSMITAVPVEGKLLFYVHLPKSKVIDPATRLQLSVRDIYGVETMIEQIMGNWLSR